MKTLRLSLVWGLLLILQLSAANAQERPAWAKETKEQKGKRMKWWTDARFGMFIHWGLYAVPARHEWVKYYERIADKDYEKYFNLFDPDLYNPKQWAAKAKEAGMKYFVITTKHHEGFSLWDTKYSDYKATKTPAARDLIKPMVEAFRAEGIKVGFYYSLIDWHHPDFELDASHPPTPQGKEAREAANKGRDQKKYQAYMKNQITELLTQFGPIDVLFTDFSYEGKGHKEWDSENLLKLIRKLQPNIIVNDRLDLNDTDWGWDIKTPEQFMPREWVTVKGEKVPWETCQTFSGSWGYHRDENSWKSVPQLIAMLIETVSKGGNLLLNVGPTARGEFDERANQRLEGIGAWMKQHSRSIYGCTQAPDTFKVPQNCFLTYNAEKKRLYIHLMQWPFKSLHLEGFKGKFKYAQLLNDGSEIKFYSPTREGSHTTETAKDGDVILNLPVQKPNVEVPVIELILE
ncbi:alpha-L-fucosidase [Pedobacter steynii]|uniref:alpha-L-fucosidase n=1 Tax=Pedobacter steynii TaxID=430522 RepID=A0A1H0L3B3_9SPHI|nr:alpha-L-fucosidase [Pedobacter steynii]NQX43403.1 alpha-L-fucosidase [Pedobacter steynii]SDO62513.1 alpha-L-fucosidase [Pedobacter steynii]